MHESACMKVRFKSKVTRGFYFLATSRKKEKSRKTSETRMHLHALIIIIIIIIIITTTTTTTTTTIAELRRPEGEMGLH